MRAHRVLLSTLCSLPLWLGCSGEASLSDGGTELQAPEITSVTPASGPDTGGTSVTLRGTNFQLGARVWFGAAEATAVSFVSRAQLTVTTGQAVSLGKVDVKITNPDGQTHSLPGAFTYEKSGERAVVQALVLNAATKKDTSGAATVQVAISAEVEVSAATAGKGQGAGVRAQVGYKLAPLDPASGAGVIWVDASYVADADGPVTGDLARDQYEAKVELAGATGAEVREYVLVARFSIDSGATWVVADRDGSANGTTADQLPHVTVLRPVPDWCKLGGEVVEPPPEVALRVGQTGPQVLAQVLKSGLTNAAGAGAGMTAEVGYGPVGSDPAAAGWTWSPAAYVRDSGGGANDEYGAPVPNPGAGSFAFAFRFTLNGGAPLYCDADSSDLGFSPDMAGKLTVTPVDVDACKLVAPASYLAQPGAPSPLLAGRVFATTVTDAAGQGAGITAQLGYGPAGSQPGAGWTWVAATYGSDQDSSKSDEYRQRVPALAAGDYDVAYRFHYQGRPDVLCDLDGSANGYAPAQAYKLKVVTASIQSCKLSALTSGTLASGARLSVYGQVKVTGITEATGPGHGVRGQVGVGAAGTNASLGGWAWREAIFFGDLTATGEDQLRGDIQPAYTGARAVSFRFSVNNGESWTYCDLNGSDVGGYELAQQPALTVTNHADLDACQLQSPATTASRTAELLGRVTEPGLTDAAGEPVGVVAELGYGPRAEDPGVSNNWRWLAAEYSSQAGAADEFKATLAGVPAGSYDYAYRFARTVASPYCYGDLDGHSAASGFSGAVGSLGQATLP